MANETTQMVMHMNAYPLMDGEKEISSPNIKLPLSKLSALGVAFDPLASAIYNITGTPDMTGGMYRVTVPSGTHLAQYKNGQGYLGAALNENNQLAGQATLQPFICDPTMIFMAVTLANIDKKLDVIEELQHEMLEYLTQKEKADQRGNLNFLFDILHQYRYNWNNDTYKNNNYLKVLDILQESEKKIVFYHERIRVETGKNFLVHSNKSVKMLFNKVQEYFKEYQLVLYSYGFASFLGIMLLGNFTAEYLDEIIQKIQRYSLQYREIYTDCYNKIEQYFHSSVQASVVRTMEKVSTETGRIIAKAPLIGKGHIDESLMKAGSKFNEYEKHVEENMKGFVDRQSGYTKPFIDNINTVKSLYAHPLELLFDKNTLYLPVDEI